MNPAEVVEREPQRDTSPVSLSPEFSRALVNEIREQSASAPLDRAAYNRAINAAYGTHDVDSMLLRATIRGCGGL